VAEVRATPPPTTESTPEVAKEKTPSDYPALKADIAQADLKTMDGSTFKIADKKGKVILINLWATWCGPCLAEMPSFVKMKETYGPQGFEILGLDTDDESDTLMDDINKVIKEKNINYPIVFSDTQTQVALLNISKFNGIPQSFLVDADGNLRAVFKGANKENVVKIEEIVSGLVGQNNSSE
jgi:thiol-disulfide isomerase/thioredoxin